MFLQALSIVAKHNHSCWARERIGQSEVLVSKPESVNTAENAQNILFCSTRATFSWILSWVKSPLFI